PFFPPLRFGERAGERGREPASSLPPLPLPRLPFSLHCPARSESSPLRQGLHASAKTAPTTRAPGPAGCRRRPPPAGLPGGELRLPRARPLPAPRQSSFGRPPRLRAACLRLRGLRRLPRPLLLLRRGASRRARAGFLPALLRLWRGGGRLPALCRRRGS